MVRNDYGYPDQQDLWQRAKWYVIPALILTLLLGFVLLACAEPVVLTASWYSTASLKKEGTWKNGEQKMANGKRFDENALTCATRLWPLGTRLVVTNRGNGRSVEVVVADRIGARFAKTRIDLSRGAFSAIEDLKKGVTQVEVEVIR